MLRDLRLAIRRLARDWARTVASVTTLASAIAVATVAWTLVSATPVRPLPVPAIDRWVVVHANADGGRVQREFVHPAFARIRDAGVFERTVGAWVPLETLVLTVNGTTHRVRVGFVTGDYLSSLGIGAQAGRSLSPDDNRRGAAPVAVLTNRFWRLAYQGRHDVLGGTARLGAGHASLIGVTAAGFRGLDLSEAPDLYVPLSVIGDVGSSGTNYFADPAHPALPTAGVRIVGRLRDGESPAQAVSRLAAAAASSEWLDGASLDVTPLASAALKGDARTGVVAFSRMLTGTVVLLLLLGCAAIGLGLLMAIESRRRELATCLALGASVSTLLRGLTLEAALISGAAALGALPIAQGLLRGLCAYSLPGGVSIALLGVHVDAGALATCLVTGGVVFLVLTAGTSAYAYGRLRSLTMLVWNSRGTGGARARSWTVLLAAQVAIALLLSGARLFVRSLQAAFDLNRGVHTDTVVRTELNLAAHGYDATRSAAFFDEWQARMQALPAIREVAYAVDEGGMGTRGRLTVDGEPRRFPDIVRFKAVAPTFFAAMGVPVIDGRGFDARDAAAAPPVAVASASLARLLSRNGSAVGRTVAMPLSGGPPRVATVAGVVPDLIDDLDALQPLTLYVPMAQRVPGTYRTIILRAAGDVDAARQAAVAAARSLDAAIAVPPLPTMRDDEMASQRLGSAVLGVLGVVALLLTIVSTYVLAAAVAAARTGEIGVRIALGATRGRVIALLLRDASRPLAAGLAIGAALVLAGGGVLRALLFEVEPGDPWALAQVVGLLVAVAAAASLGPALQAARADVAATLRQP